jgi:hypothetical protein
MTIGNETPAPGQSTIDGLHEITDAAELDAIMAGDGKPVDGDGKATTPPAAKKPAPSKPATPPAPAAGEESTEGGEGSDNDEEEEEENGEDPVYPSMLHYLNETHQLGLNLEDGQVPTAEEQTEAISEILSRMTQGVNNALAQYAHIDTLLQDAEVKRVLELKAQNKTMKDIVAEFAATPQGQSDDELVINDFKKRYPKATPEMISSMVEPLKKNGQFAAFATGLREQAADEQRSNAEAAENARKEQERVQAENDQKELQAYTQFVGSQKTVFGVPLTDQMKQQLIQATTVRDDKGMTYLDHALQSNEGTVLAALGIMFMQDLMKNGASVEGNRSKAKFVNKLFQRPDALQSGGQGAKKDEFDPALANRF